MIEDIAPLFAPGSKLLYLGDTAKKIVTMETGILKELGFDASNHDKLPDVVLYDWDRNWLILMEAAISHGPISPKQVFEFQELSTSPSAGLVYVSAFPTRPVFRRSMSSVAWEIEVWMADAPDHLIHFNGDQFLGPCGA